MSGILNTFKLAAAVAVAASVVPVTSGLNQPIAAGQTKKFRWWLPISVGAAGGIRLQVTVPAAGTLFNCSIVLNNTVAPSSTLAMQVASAVFTNALANAGNHWVEVEAEVVNGVNAGTVDLVFAQNTSDATPVTLLRGATLDVNTL